MPDPQEFLSHLNEAQRQAVTHGEGPLLVLAGPGSGKTTVIVKRIQYLITQMHVPPEEILVITFTKDAAMSMQQRFQASMPQQTIPVNFGTFHSVFYHILLQSPDFHFRPSDSQASPSGFPVRLLTESQKKNFMIPLLKNIRRREQQNSYTPDNMSSEAGEMLSAVSFYKNTGDEAGAARRLSTEWKPHFREVLEAYQRETRGKNALDFDDMVYECRKLLEGDEHIRSRWQGRFSHILMDEFQDINPVQYQVIKLLTREPYNLFAVGDDDQAIYGFRGADPACLRMFADEFRAGRILLDVNYRSREEIVKAAGKVIAENKERFEKKLRALPGARKESDPAGAVKILCFPGRQEQNDYLRGQISEFLKNKPEQSCAVLFRTNLFLQSFAAGLERAGIPYTMREKTKNLYEHFIAKDIMAYLRFAAGDRSRSLFLQFMNKPSRFLSRESLAGEDIIDPEALKRWYRAKGGPSRFEQLEAIDTLLIQLRAMEKMPPYLAVSYVCKAVGYERWLREQAGSGGERKQEWLEVLEWLKEDAKGYASVEEWLEEQKNHGAGSEGKRTKNVPERSENSVQLMTVHAAKGLEFDKVWIPECNEKNFPHGSMPEHDAVEEERRIFYVGMTRAKTSLELLWLTGTKERPRLMSRFLNPLAPDYLSSSTSSSNSQLSRYSSNASATFSYSASSSI